MSAPMSAYGGRGPGIVVLGWTLAALAGILVGVRIYVRVKLERQGTWALFWVVFAWLVTITSQCMTTVAALNGAGNHIGILLKANSIEEFMLWDYLTNSVFLGSIALGKVAAASFLLAVIEASNRKWIRLALWSISLSNIVIIIPNVFLVWLQCVPAKYLWNKHILGSCPSERTSLDYTIFQGSFAAFSDLALALIPIAIIHPLQMPPRKKLGLCTLMGLGVLSAAFASLRTYYIRQLLTPDPSYASADLDYWAEGECFTVLIACSVPPAWPFVRRLWPRLVLWSPRHRNGDEDGDGDGDGVPLRQVLVRAGTPGREVPFAEFVEWEACLRAAAARAGQASGSLSEGRRSSGVGV